MSQAQKFMDLLKEGAQRMGNEIGNEFTRQVGRGASEAANALFSGQGFVLYGHGNSHPANENQLGKENSGQGAEGQQQQNGHEHHRGRGM